jgi:hypothetical protein
MRPIHDGSFASALLRCAVCARCDVAAFAVLVPYVLYVLYVRADVVMDSYSLSTLADGANGEYSPAADGFACVDAEGLTVDAADDAACRAVQVGAAAIAVEVADVLLLRRAVTGAASRDAISGGFAATGAADVLVAGEAASGSWFWTVAACVMRASLLVDVLRSTDDLLSGFASDF